MSLHFHDLQPGLADFRGEVLAGLAARPRVIAPKFFYDARGSQLFEAITGLPEYYPTRTEIGILERHGAAISSLLGSGCLLVELGSGSSRKIRVLLESLRPAVYMPIDISGEHLMDSARTLAGDFPDIELHAVCADYTGGLSLPAVGEGLRRVAFYPGSSIGNFDPQQAVGLLQRVRGWLGGAGVLLVGVDLRKSKAVLDAAYDDAQGVTAAFNLNLLQRLRRELGARLEPADFEHLAFYDESRGRVEMHLRARRATAIHLDGRSFAFEPGETIHTENSYKYTIEGFRGLAGRAGFDPLEVWTDPDRLFSVHALRVAG